MSEEGGSCKEENDEARGREAGWTRVQAVLLWASREDGTGHTTRSGGGWASTEHRTPAPNHLQVTGLPLHVGGKWVGLTLNCTAPSVLVADGTWFDSLCVCLCVCVCVCVSTSRRVSRSLSVNAANVRSLKFQHQGQGHYLTPLFLFTHSACCVVTGSVNNNNNITNISFCRQPRNWTDLPNCSML